MIELTYGWRCTKCGHSKNLNPLREEPPKKCPACKDDGEAFTGENYDDMTTGMWVSAITLFLSIFEKKGGEKDD